MSRKQNGEATDGPYGSAHDLPSFVEMRQQLRIFKGLTHFVMRDKRSELADLEQRVIATADRVDAFYDRLGSRHWTYNDWLNTDRVDAMLAETTTPEEAEGRLIQLYQDPEATKWQLLRLRSISGLRERHHLLVRAREDYDAGRFDTCTMLLISVMDGFVNDFEAAKRRGLAARDADEMVAWNSVTGHHMGLTNALKPFLKTIKKRIDEEVFEVHRHGIVHGSVVNFNNAVVATKAWNLLYAVVDWTVATSKKAEEDAKPPAPGLKETLSSLAELGRKRKARDQFKPWVVERDDSSFAQDGVVVQTMLLIEAWQRKQWGRLAPLMPPPLTGGKTRGAAAEFAKACFDTHTIEDAEIERIEYTQSSVAEACGTATIDGRTGRLRLRWVYYDAHGNLALNGEDGSWQLAVVAPRTFIHDDTSQP